MPRDARGEIPVIFAGTGDVAEPDVANFEDGYEVAFQEVEGKIPTRVGFNRLFQQLFTMGKDVSQYGAALPYSQTIDFLVDGVVTQAGVLFICTQINGPGSTVKIPGVAGSEAFWTDFSAAISSSFTGLTDTPANYTGEALKTLRVNGAEDGVEFADAPSGVTQIDFTPVLSDEGIGGNLATIGTANGRSFQIGNQVTVLVNLENIDTTGMTPANFLHLRTLPVGIDPMFEAHSIIATQFVDLQTNKYLVTANQGGDNNSLLFAEIKNSQGHTFLNVSDLISTTVNSIRFNITYSAAP